MANDTDDYSEIMLDGWHFKLEGVITETAIDRLAPKQTTGDYTRDSNDLLSAWVMGDLTGGHGQIDLIEGVDDNRYRFGTLYTRYPNQISKPFKIASSTLGSGILRPHGDITYSGTTYRMMSSGGTLYQDSTSRGAMGGTPSAGNRGVYFGGTNAQPVFYVATSVGYSAFDPSTNTLRNVASPNIVALVEWDNKLISLDTVGQLRYATAGTASADTTWTSYGSQGKLDPAFTPVSLIVYYNRSGEPAIHLITDRNVWIFDPATPRLYPIPDFGAVHPYFGKGSAVWRGELFVTAGMDILAYNGNVVRNIGLSRDGGLPYNYQGYVKSLCAGQNALYALVQGQTSGGVTYHSVHEWSGLGWHCLYTTSNAQVPTQLAISNSTANGYRLYWGIFGTSGTYFYQQLPTTFTNPRAAIEQAALDMIDLTNFSSVYNTLYYLESGRFDGNMKGYVKIANAVEVDIRSILNSTDTETYTLKYRIDNDTNWTTLGTASSAGHHIFQFGTLANSIYPGVSFETIEFRHEVQDAIAAPGIGLSTSFVMDSAVFSYLVRKNPSLAWTVTVNLNQPHNEQSPENMRNKINALRTSGTFFPAVIQGTTYRCRISGVAGPRQTGKDTRGLIQLSIIEIPTKPGIPA